MDICLVCKKCQKILIANEDIPNNTNKPVLPPTNLQQHLTVSLPEPTPELLAARTEQQQQDAVKASKPPSHAGYNRYLHQFSENACEIPEHLHSLVYERLASCHLLSNLRCKPVPVENILKKHRLQKYMSHATRISRMFNATPLPVFTQDLIDRLVQRFDELHANMSFLQESGSSVGKLSLPGKEALTHIFLRMENEHTLSRAFATHKNVSTAQKQKFWALLDQCSKRSTLSWKC